MLELANAMQALSTQILAAEQDMQALSKKEDESRAELFKIQHTLSNKRHEAQAAERQLSEARVELARLETRRDGFLGELRQYAPQLETELESLMGEDSSSHGQLPPEQLFARMQRLRTQLEWIGGIDPETVKVLFLRTPNVDLTPRLKPFIQPDGINMQDAELPPGEYMVRVDIKDSDGRPGTASFILKVAPK